MHSQVYVPPRSRGLMPAHCSLSSSACSTCFLLILYSTMAANISSGGCSPSRQLPVASPPEALRFTCCCCSQASSSCRAVANPPSSC